MFQTTNQSSIDFRWARSMKPSSHGAGKPHAPIRGIWHLHAQQKVTGALQHEERAVAQGAAAIDHLGMPKDGCMVDVGENVVGS